MELDLRRKDKRKWSSKRLRSDGFEGAELHELDAQDAAGGVKKEEVCWVIYIAWVENKPSAIGILFFCAKLA